MKLLRFGETGKERPGILDAEGKIRDLSGLVGDIGADELSREGLARIAKADPASLPRVEGSPRLGPCVARPSKIVGIGLNYRKHAAEGNVPVPSEPIVFIKSTSALSGPNDPIILPLNATKVDWEIELGVVMGKTARYVAEKDAASYIAGYCTANDVSERAFQIERQGQWTKGKSADSFAPLGPYMVTADEVPNPQALRLYCQRNGKTVQDSSTADMIFGVFHIVSYVSQFMTLLPGDVLITGTPEGVAMGMKPPDYLKDGDTIRCGIDGLGEQLHAVNSYR
jgi:2-keto-4-pentenoate hydratase/2-oxohepta-3-ene-1,7-dioic acid hydratase in catechol pathway